MKAIPLGGMILFFFNFPKLFGFAILKTVLNADDVKIKVNSPDLFDHHLIKVKPCTPKKRHFSVMFKRR